MAKKERKKDNQFMLVRQASDEKLKAVTKIEQDGNLQTVDLSAGNPPDLSNLLNISTMETPLENFLKKFLQELSEPSHTGIFIIAEKVLNQLVQLHFPDEELEKCRIDPLAEMLKINPDWKQPLDMSKIDLEDLHLKGIRMEDLEPYQAALSWGYKTNQLIDMNPEVSPGLRIPTKGRVSLQEQPDGSVKAIPHYWQQEVDLNAPFHGVYLDDEVKRNIAATRHAGKVVDLELSPNTLTPCYVSKDRLTNTLEYMPCEDFKKFSSIKQVELSQGKQVDLFNGGSVLLEKFVTREGYFRDAHIQIDASERNIHFDFSGLDRNRYKEENLEIYRQKQAAKNVERQENAPGMRIHRYIKGVRVPDEAFDHWTEAVNDPSKRKDVKAFYLEGMTDEKGQKFNSWVMPDFERGKFRFPKWNPNKREQGQREQTRPQYPRQDNRPRQNPALKPQATAKAPKI